MTQIIRDMDKLTSVSRCLEEQGLTFEYRPLLCRITEANSVIARRLRLPLATKVLEILRLRLINGATKTVERVILPYDLVPGLQLLDLHQLSLSVILKDHYQLTPVRSEEEVSLASITEEEAELYGLGNNTEVVVIRGTAYYSPTVPLEHYEIIAVPDFFSFRSTHYYG